MKEILVERISDKNELEKVHLLTTQGLMESGFLKTNSFDPHMPTSLNPELDTSSQTWVLAIKKIDEIIGTVSLTKDGPKGLNTDKLFKEETDKLRTEYNLLGSVWRILTARSYREDRRIFLELMKKAFEILANENVDVCLIMVEKKYAFFYKKMIGAKIISTKKIKLSNDLGIKEMSLMSTDRISIKKGRIFQDLDTTNY